MNNNSSAKKAWVTPSIEEAPVLITKGGRLPSNKEAGNAFNNSPTYPS